MSPTQQNFPLVSVLSYHMQYHSVEFKPWLYIFFNKSSVHRLHEVLKGGLTMALPFCVLICSWSWLIWVAVPSYSQYCTTDIKTLSNVLCLDGNGNNSLLCQVHFCLSLYDVTWEMLLIPMNAFCLQRLDTVHLMFFLCSSPFWFTRI